MKITTFAIFLFIQFATGAAARQPLKLGYNEPGNKSWTSALPIGNGRLGAMVYGNPANKCIQLNEATVWSGSPYRNDSPDALAALPEIRKLIFEGKQKEAQALAGKMMQSKNALRKNYAQLTAEHIAAYQKYFNRVKLNLATTGPTQKPTNVRLKEFALNF